MWKTRCNSRAVADGCTQELGKNKTGRLVTKKYVDGPLRCMCILCEDIHVLYKGLQGDIYCGRGPQKSDGKMLCLMAINHSLPWSNGFGHVPGMEIIHGRNNMNFPSPT